MACSGLCLLGPEEDGLPVLADSAAVFAVVAASLAIGVGAWTAEIRCVEERPAGWPSTWPTRALFGLGDAPPTSSGTGPSRRPTSPTTTATSHPRRPPGSSAGGRPGRQRAGSTWANSTGRGESTTFPPVVGKPAGTWPPPEPAAHGLENSSTGGRDQLPAGCGQTPVSAATANSGPDAAAGRMVHRDLVESAPEDLHRQGQVAGCSSCARSRRRGPTWNSSSM